MKLNLLFKISSLSVLLVGCSRDNADKQVTDDLVKKVALVQQDVTKLKQDTEAFKPDLGVIMSGVEMHYSKLILAGLNRNWDLARYQVEEIKTELTRAVGLYKDLKLATDKLKSQNNISEPEISEIEGAILERNSEKFINGYKNLTTACNACHQVAGASYIVVQPPQGPEFTNQNFEKRKSMSPPLDKVLPK